MKWHLLESPIASPDWFYFTWGSSRVLSVPCAKCRVRGNWAPIIHSTLRGKEHAQVQGGPSCPPHITLPSASASAKLLKLF